jgi:uncharacterized protein
VAIKDFEGGHLEMSTAARSGVTQELSSAYVREIFKNLESGDGKGFFDYVLDDVDWTVEGTHPLAGHYHSKAEFLAHTFEKLGKVLPKGAELYVERVVVSGDWAVVELRSDATANDGLRFDNRYCWICRFVNGTIVEVRAYLDSALVARLFEEPRVQAPYWYRFTVGEAEITVVSDGWQMLGDPTNSFLGVPKDEVRKQLTEQLHEPGGYEYRAQLVRR